MRILLFVWLIINGTDQAGPPIEMPFMETCQTRAEMLLATEIPDGSTLAVGCVTERAAGKKS